MASQAVSGCSLRDTVPLVHDPNGGKKLRNKYGVVTEPPLIVSADIVDIASKQEKISILKTPSSHSSSVSGKFVIASDGIKSNRVKLFALLTSPATLRLADLEHVADLPEEQAESLMEILENIDRIKHQYLLPVIGNLTATEIHFNTVLGGGIITFYAAERKIEAGFSSASYGAVCPSVLADSLSPYFSDYTLHLHGFPDELRLGAYSLKDVSAPPQGDRQETAWYHRRGIPTIADIREQLVQRNSLLPPEPK